ncbi:hypothetical protein scyTo_0024520, partial [Scyliorhinus torazame]|nr:hypothetical protein [Scyliorhinus torazame]
ARLPPSLTQSQREGRFCETLQRTEPFPQEYWYNTRLGTMSKSIESIMNDVDSSRCVGIEISNKSRSYILTEAA